MNDLKDYYLNEVVVFLLRMEELYMQPIKDTLVQPEQLRYESPDRSQCHRGSAGKSC